MDEMAGAPPDASRAPDADGETLTAQLKSVLHDLEKEAERRVGLRQAVEERWLEDLRQYHGRYDETTRKALDQAGRSSIFLNLTRPKTNMLSARLFDMLFPADDRNWDIQPTPAPTLTEEAERIAEQAATAEQAAEEGDEAAAAEADMLRKAADELSARLDVAERAGDGMRREIADQLTECRYDSEVRDAIDDACKIGIGIVKGPVTGQRSRRRWAKVGPDQPGGPAAYVLEDVPDPAPAFWRVDPWAFFPDPDVRTVADGEGVMVRHLMNPKQLRRLSRLEGFDPDAVRRVLKTAPNVGLPTNMEALRDILGDTSTPSDRYHVWEYEGPLTAEQLLALAVSQGDEATAGEYAEADPLVEAHAIVWWCNGEVMRFDMHPLDTDETRYSIFTVERDEASVFGYGLPRVMRDVQSWLNASARMTADNGSVAAGPQVVVMKDLVEPEDGDWRPRPWKVWLTKAAAALQGQGNQPPFQFVQPSANLDQLIPQLELAMRFLDEITGMPQQLAGEPGATPQQTATGTALMLSSANVLFRRIVKNFDDDMTVPNIRRLYAFNMQFSEKEEIKGDHEVKARGSSALMVRELQSQNLIALLNIFGSEDPDVKSDEMKAEVFRSLNIDPARFLRSPSEREAFAAQMAEADGAAQAEMDLKRQELELKEQEISSRVAMTELAEDRRLQVAIINQETTMMEMAEKLNLTMEQMQAKLRESREARDSKERIVAAEAALAERTGRSAGGYV